VRHTFSPKHIIANTRRSKAAKARAVAVEDDPVAVLPQVLATAVKVDAVAPAIALGRAWSWRTSASSSKQAPMALQNL
jgi:hypothetical protein